MKYIGRLVQEPVLKQRTYTAEDGSEYSYDYRTVVLHCGADRFTGEMVGDAATHWNHEQQVDLVTLWAAEVNLNLKSIPTPCGGRRNVTVVRVSRLDPLV
jgi:hypothetical protein